jgi:tetratricopeptide (TPR) repeat protein
MDARVHHDRFGNVVSAADVESVGALEAATEQLLDFSGDPIAALDPANEADPQFVMGSVLCAAYRLLGGVRPDAPAVTADLGRLATRAHQATAREAAHCEAALALADGAFDVAAIRWDAIAAQHPRDLLAAKLTHEVCLHIGNDEIRLRSAERAVATAPFDGHEVGAGVLRGHLAFALEEVGRYEEAEAHGRAALAVNPSDLWARHALAHVYESTERHDEALDVLLSTKERWAQQVGLAHHMWWHVGLRLLNHGDCAEAAAVFDTKLAADAAFGLADAASLLWRLELAEGREAADHRWRRLADGWAAAQELHNTGFLDLHAAMTFAAHECAAGEQFWRDLRASHSCGDEFNHVTFRTVVRPVAEGVRAFRAGEHEQALELLAAAAPELHRIGGSVVQRRIVGLTSERAASLAGVG